MSESNKNNSSSSNRVKRIASCTSVTSSLAEMKIEDRLMEMGERMDEARRQQRLKSAPKFKPDLRATKSYHLKDFDRYDEEIGDRLFKIALQQQETERQERQAKNALLSQSGIEGDSLRALEQGVRLYSPIKKCYPNIFPNPDPKLAPSTKTILNSATYVIRDNEKPVETWLLEKGKDYQDHLHKLNEDMKVQYTSKYKLERYNKPEIVTLKINENSSKIVKEKEMKFENWTHEYRLSMPIHNVDQSVLREVDYSFTPKINKVAEEVKVTSQEDLEAFYYSITSPESINNSYILPNHQKVKRRGPTRHLSTSGFYTTTSSTLTMSSMNTMHTINNNNNNDISDSP